MLVPAVIAFAAIVMASAFQVLCFHEVYTIEIISPTVTAAVTDFVVQVGHRPVLSVVGQKRTERIASASSYLSQSSRHSKVFQF
jgi:hypothetical protein